MLRAKPFVITAIVAVLVLVVAAPSFATTEPAASPTNNQDDVLRIGVLTDHTSGLALYGFELTQGFELGLEYATNGTMEVAGRPIEIVMRDNAGDIDTAVADARELIEEEGVEVLVGSPSSTVTLNLQATAAEYETILMAGPAATPAITGVAFNEYTFRVCRNTFQDAATAATFAIDEYGPKYVILGSDNAFGVGTAEAFDAVFQLVGAERARDTILFAEDTTDFTPPLTEVLDSGADFTVMICAGTSCVSLINQRADLGVRDQMGIVEGFNSNDLMALFPYSVGDIGYIVYHYTAPDNPVNDWLVEQHMERYEGDPPDLFTACSFATAQALVAAFEVTEGDTLPETMIPALEGLTFDSPKGEITIRAEDHQALVPMYAVEVVDLEPEEPHAYYELIREVTKEEAAPPCTAPAERSSEDLECGQ